MITVYSTSTCAYCKMVKGFLTRKGHEYQEVNLEDNPDKRQELLDKTGAMTVPIIQIGDQFVVGWNPGKMMELL